MALFDTVKDMASKLAELPLRRPDADLVRNVHPYRRMLWYLMPGRNESIVYYDDYVKADAILDYMHRAREAWGTDVDITHALVAAAGIGFYHQPKMNQFVVGKRLYKRNHNAITFSMKRKKKDKEAKLSAVKMRFDDPNEAFQQTCRRINAEINRERSGEKTYSDKELALMYRLPRPLLEAAMLAMRWADNNNLLPAAFIENDPFYASMVIANLGSLGMRAAFHHLYEYGTCSLFLMVGKIEDRPVCKDGKVVPEKTLHLRWAYDERIDDGLTSAYGMAEVRNRLENPEEFFGKVEAAPAANEEPEVAASSVA